MNIDALVSITRSTGGEDGSCAILSVQDQASGVTFLRMRLSFETLGNLITGAAYLTPLNTEVQHLDKVGLYKETCTVKWIHGKKFATQHDKPFMHRLLIAAEAFLKDDKFLKKHGTGWEFSHPKEKQNWSQSTSGTTESGKFYVNLTYVRYVKGGGVE